MSTTRAARSARTATATPSAAVAPRRPIHQAPRPADSPPARMTPAAAGWTSERDDADEGDDDGVAAPRHPDPQLPVDHAVDVVDDRGEQVAATATQAARGQGHDGLVDLDPATGQEPERHVVRAQPLGVPEHRTGQAEGADAHDRHQQGEDGRASGGLHDQPAGGRGQRDAGRRGEGGQGRARREPRLRQGVGRSRRGSATGSTSAGWTVGAGAAVRGHRRRGQLQPVVGDRDQRGAMGHHDHGAAAAEVDQGVGDDLLGQLVEVGGGLVEQHPRTVGHHHASQGQSGPLAGGQGGAVLAQRRRQPVRQGQDPLLECHLAQCGPQLVVRSVRAAQPQVVGDAAAHEVRALGEPGDLLLPARGRRPVVRRT